MSGYGVHRTVQYFANISYRLVPMYKCSLAAGLHFGGKERLRKVVQNLLPSIKFNPVFC